MWETADLTPRWRLSVTCGAYYCHLIGYGHVFQGEQDDWETTTLLAGKSRREDRGQQVAAYKYLTYH